MTETITPEQEAELKANPIISTDTTFSTDSTTPSPEGSTPEPQDDNKSEDTAGQGDQPRDLPDITLDVDTDVESLSDEQIDTVVTDAGFNLEDIQKEILEAGEISDDLVTRLKDKLDPALVDAHVGRFKAELELQKSKAQEQNKATEDMNKYIFKAVKGEDNFKAMAGYLRENLSESELTVLNDLLQSGDKAKVDIALQSSVNKYNSLKGKGNLMTGEQAVPEEPKEPMTKDQYFEIMKTEKYKTDRSYQKQVDAERLQTITLDQKRFPKGTHFYKDATGTHRL